MEKIKLEKGITLIALIITIVVLLILAVVTINAVKDGGIITHAQNATQKHVVGDEKERIQLAYYDYKISVTEPIERTPDQDELETVFVRGANIYNIINNEKSTEDILIIDYKGEEIEIKSANSIDNEETKESYVYFLYNGYKYKLTFVYNSIGKIEKLEAVKKQPLLKVEGADVTGDEESTWVVKFSDTGNTYIVNRKGKIEGEYEILKKYILGPDLTGRLITDIMDLETVSFIDDTITDDIDETQALALNVIGEGEEENLTIVYIESQSAKYKFAINSSGETDINYGVIKLNDLE